MARYRGPRVRLQRRLRTTLPGLTRKSAENRPYPPGQHGASAGRGGRRSDYGVRLDEKQKLRFNYGVSERKLRSYFKRAKSMKGDTGHNLLTLLEQRLDNVVFRAGFAPTIPAARQLVLHGHILVDGKRVNIASYEMRAGQKISIREKSRKLPIVESTMASPSLMFPSYISVEPELFLATFTAEPAREDVPLEIQENLVVEHYSRVA
jgi:small subunit ribosomal protein S4